MDSVRLTQTAAEDLHGNGEMKHDSRRKRTVSTNENVHHVEELMLSQYDQPGTQRIVRLYSAGNGNAEVDSTALTSSTRT